MPVVSSYAFVNNRGGTGKSFCLFQVATAYAKANPDKKVLVLDCSAHGDVSQYLLGGTQEPFEREPTASTAGSQKLKTIPVEQTMAGLLMTILKIRVSDDSLTGRFRGMVLDDGNIDVMNHCVQVSNYSQEEQQMPENLWLSGGGANLPTGRVSRPLFGDPPPQTAIEMSKKANTDDWIKAGRVLHDAVLRLKGDWVVFFDTDAELCERGPSLVALLAAKRLVIVVTEKWSDYLRLYNDPVNAFFPTLPKLSQEMLTGRIHMVLFNRVDKLNQKEVALHEDSTGKDATLPFSPVSAVQKNMAEISDDMYYRCYKGVCTDYRRFFDDNLSIQSTSDFASRFVTCFYNFPALATKISHLGGIPFVCIVANRAYKLKNRPNDVGPVGTDTLRVIQETVEAVVQRL